MWCYPKLFWIRTFGWLALTVMPWISVFAAPTAKGMPAQRIEVLQGGTSLGIIDPYSGVFSAAANYNYIQPSGSPISGPNSAAFQGRLFFYEGSDGLHFNILLNTPALGRGTVDWTISVTGSSTDPIVKVTDDPAPPADHTELFESPNDVFTGAWGYAGNTDGGVIGPLAGSEWSIFIDQLAYTSDNGRGINTLRVYDGSGSWLPLNLNSGPSGQIVFRSLVIPEPTASSIAVAFMVTLGFRVRGLKRL